MVPLEFSSKNLLKKFTFFGRNIIFDFIPNFLEFSKFPKILEFQTKWIEFTKFQISTDFEVFLNFWKSKIQFFLH